MKIKYFENNVAFKKKNKFGIYFKKRASHFALNLEFRWCTHIKKFMEKNESGLSNNCLIVNIYTIYL